MIPNNDTESVIKKLEWELAEKEKEIAELKAWKKSAMSVMAPMDKIGKALGVRLGGSIHDKILPGIEYCKARYEAAEKVLELIEITRKQFTPGSPHLAAIKKWDQLKNTTS